MLWIDGNVVDPAEPLDRGLEFGDGLFETLAVVAARPRLLERHLARLGSGAERLGIVLPAIELMRRELASAAATPGTAVLKLVVTRGRGGRGYSAEPQAPSRRWLAALGARVRPGEWQHDGVAVRICSTRLAEQPVLAGLKHLNRLEQVLARREWVEPSIAEGLMLDLHGRLICGTMSNVFAVIDEVLVTPSLTRAGVAGVMRALFIDSFRAAGCAVQERDLEPVELESASEVFLSNALIGAWPVRALAAQRWPVGPWTRRAQEMVAAA